MLLVEPLGGGERAPRREAEERVGVALERGEVVEELRALALLLLLELGDLARRCPPRPRRPPCASASAEPALAAEVAARCSGARRSASKRASTSQYGSGLKARISSSRRATSASVGVCTRPSETAPSNAARSRIDAARVAFMPTTQSASERERAAASSGFISSPGRSAPKASPIARFGHRGEPEPVDRLVHAGRVEHVGEDQLALAAGVAGVDDPLDLGVGHQLVDRLQLLRRRARRSGRA